MKRQLFASVMTKNEMHFRKSFSIAVMAVLLLLLLLLAFDMPIVVNVEDYCLSMWYILCRSIIV
jgi:hypothetical protein